MKNLILTITAVIISFTLSAQAFEKGDVMIVQVLD